MESSHCFTLRETTTSAAMTAPSPHLLALSILAYFSSNSSCRVLGVQRIPVQSQSAFCSQQLSTHVAVRRAYSMSPAARRRVMALGKANSALQFLMFPSRREYWRSFKSILYRCFNISRTKCSKKTHCSVKISWIYTVLIR